MNNIIFYIITVIITLILDRFIIKTIIQISDNKKIDKGDVEPIIYMLLASFIPYVNIIISIVWIMALLAIFIENIIKNLEGKEYNKIIRKIFFIK